jgi:aspartyl-tRNA(Asn)/glutamyl-tRNA(Gln) amidotransferase subunit A
MMGAIAGFDPLDPVSIEAPPQDFAAAIGADVSALRIGTPRAPYFEDLHPDIAAAVAAALDVLRGLVAEVRDAELGYPDTFPMLVAEIYAYHAELVADPERRALYDPITLGRIMDGASVPTTVYIEGRRQMAIARNRVNKTVFADVDILVTPTAMVLPETIESVLAGGLPSDLPLLRNTLPYDVLGVPTISVPCGFSAGGLPIGLQIAGPRLGEAKVLALAHAYEQATDWHKRRPPI